MILWLNPVAGLSGDMFLGALLDLGAPVEQVREIVASTGITGWTLEPNPVRGGIVATRAVVSVSDNVPERRAAELLAIVRRAKPTAVAELAALAVEAIARVEAELHGEHPETVHLHELGGLDTVVDTVGVAAALHLLGVTEVHCAALPMGSGTVSTRHGELPLPAPATAALLAEAGAQISGTPIAGETVTPTGAALLLAVSAKFGPLPPMRIERVGYGAGTRVLPGRPNVVQAILGHAAGSVSTMVLLESNVDDVTPEVLGHVITRALDEGAADAWITPVTMKKSRPGHTVHLLSSPERAETLAELLFAETGTLGIRRTHVQRATADRHTTTIHLHGQPIRIKHGPWGAKPEHDDLAVAARALGRPLRELAAEALVAVLGHDGPEAAPGAGG